MESKLLTSSNPAISAEDWQRTPPSVQQAILRLIERVTTLEQDIRKLHAEHEQLQEQTRRSSRHSSQPPSSEAPSAPSRPSRQSSGKKRGGQPGHPGHQRHLYPPEECRSVSNHRPAACGACGTILSGDDPHPVRHQVVELPEIKPLVDEHRRHQLSCRACGAVTRATLPAEISASGDGPRLVATVGLLSGPYRQRERMTQQALADLYDVDVALGTINTLREEVCEAVAQSVQDATVFAQTEAVANADETGWMQGNSDGGHPERRKAWLWVLVTSWVTVFQIHLSRSQAAARALLGESACYLITDRWAGYRWWPLDRRQVCWAHLRREFQTILARGGASQALGKGLLAQARQLFALWQRVRDGTLSREGLAAAVVEIRAAVHQWLVAGAAYEAVRGDQSARAKTARTCGEWLKVEPALWLFVRVVGVEPTNNAAERALRPAVIWRRTSLGSQSTLGSQCVARMLTVTVTLRLQQRSVLEYLTAACEAARQGHPAPAAEP